MRQLLARAQAVDRAGAHAGGHLILQCGYPDLVELVEQLGEDGEELRPLEQRLTIVLGQIEQASPEVQAGLLAVGEALVAKGLDLLVRRGDVASRFWALTASDLPFWLQPQPRYGF